MTQPHTRTESYNLLSGEAARLTEEMWGTLNRDVRTNADGPWSLMERAAGLVSDLQRQLSAQRERIAYFESLASPPYRPGDNPLEVFTRADAAMYRNKCSRRQSGAPAAELARVAS